MIEPVSAKNMENRVQFLGIYLTWFSCIGVLSHLFSYYGQRGYNVYKLRRYDAKPINN